MLSTSAYGAAKAYQELDTESRIEDASPHRLIRQFAEPGAQVVEHVMRFAGCRNRAGNGRVADDELEEELSP